MISDHKIFDIIQEARVKGRPIVVATIVSDSGSVPRHAGAKMVIFEDGSTAGTIGGGEFEIRARDAARDVFDSGKPALTTIKLVDPEKGDAGICGGQADVFLELIAGEPSLVVLGAGHCGKALAELGVWLGFSVIVVDDRQEIFEEMNLPDTVDKVVCQPEEIASRITITPNTFLAVVSRASEYDIKALPGLLSSSARYIGVMGSKRRWQLTANALIFQGITQEALSRINTPIGLDIRAETPQEIAVSVFCEIISQLRS